MFFFKHKSYLYLRYDNLNKYLINIVSQANEFKINRQIITSTDNHVCVRNAIKVKRK